MTWPTVWGFPGYSGTSKKRFRWSSSCPRTHVLVPKVVGEREGGLINDSEAVTLQIFINTLLDP